MGLEQALPEPNHHDGTIGNMPVPEPPPQENPLDLQINARLNLLRQQLKEIAEIIASLRPPSAPKPA